MIDGTSLSMDIRIIAKTDNDIIMGVEHKNSKLFGLQFHPESIETKYGMEMIENFLNIKIQRNH